MFWKLQHSLPHNRPREGLPCWGGGADDANDESSGGVVVGGSVKATAKPARVVQSGALPSRLPINLATSTLSPCTCAWEQRGEDCLD